MDRNLRRRVEVVFPIEQADLKQRVIEILKITLADNVKSRELLADGTYRRVKPAEGAQPLRESATVPGDVRGQHGSPGGRSQSTTGGRDAGGEATPAGTAAPVAVVARSEPRGVRSEKECFSLTPHSSRLTSHPFSCLWRRIIRSWTTSSGDRPSCSSWYTPVMIGASIPICLTRSWTPRLV